MTTEIKNDSNTIEKQLNERILGKNLYHAPQPALTVRSPGSLTSGTSSPPMVDSDAIILENLRVRVNQLEAALIKLGLIKKHP